MDLSEISSAISSGEADATSLVASAESTLAALQPQPLNALLSALDLEGKKVLLDSYLAELATHTSFVDTVSNAIMRSWSRSGVVLVVLPLICVYFATVLSVAKPHVAGDPNTDTESEFYHPSDNDQVPLYVSSIHDLSQLAVMVDTRMGKMKAVLMPFFAAGALYGINYVMKRFTVEKINIAMNLYVLLLTPIAVEQNCTRVLAAIGRKLGWTHRYRMAVARDLDNFPLGRLERITPEKAMRVLGKDKDHARFMRKWRAFKENLTIFSPTVMRNSDDAYNVVFDLSKLVSVPLALLVSVLFIATNPWISPSTRLETNWLVLDVVSINLVLLYTRFITLAKGKYAMSIVGFFIYDIVMVFKTPLMMNAATKLNVPLKLLVPVLTDDGVRMSFIGLGDLVIPGVFIKMCLEHDYYRYYKSGVPFHHLRPIPRPFFWTALAGYAVGLLLTFVAVHYTETGQPALLYIVPSLLIALFSTSFYFKDFAWWDNGNFLPSFGDVEEDDDDDYVVDDRAVFQEEFDEWVDKVEMKIMEEDGETDIDELVYVFETDEEDETFVIEEDEEEEEEEEEDDDNDEGDDEDDLAALQGDYSSILKDLGESDDGEEGEDE